jgi:hypothetical protein
MKLIKTLVKIAEEPEKMVFKLLPSETSSVFAREERAIAGKGAGVG